MTWKLNSYWWIASFVCLFCCIQRDGYYCLLVNNSFLWQWQIAKRLSQIANAEGLQVNEVHTYRNFFPLLCLTYSYCCFVACLFIQLIEMVLSDHRLRLRNLQKELMEISVWPSTTCSIWVSLCQSLNSMTSNSAFKAVQRMKIFPPLQLLISMLLSHVCNCLFSIIVCFIAYPYLALIFILCGILSGLGHILVGSYNSTLWFYLTWLLVEVASCQSQKVIYLLILDPLHLRILFSLCTGIKMKLVFAVLIQSSSLLDELLLLICKFLIWTC